MKNTYKVNGMNYYIINCPNEYIAAIIFVKNRVGVTVHDISKVNELKVINDDDVVYDYNDYKSKSNDNE